jgi:hypothetical protein
LQRPLTDSNVDPLLTIAGFRDDPICDRLPAFATTGLHKDSTFVVIRGNRLAADLLGWTASLFSHRVLACRLAVATRFLLRSLTERLGGDAEARPIQ